MAKKSSSKRTKGIQSKLQDTRLTLSGPLGVGKTELAKFLASGRDLEELIREFTELDRPRYYTRYGIPLIGRERDLEEIFSNLQYKRLLTLSGLPGVGKTELARQVGKEAKARRYFAHVYFISLQDVGNVDEVLRQINNQLQSINTQERTLLILDNCELIENIHRMRIALYSLLDEKKQLTILATSRVRLSVEEYEVAPLAVPHSSNEPLETLQTYDAIKLFIEIAQNRDKTFTLTENNAKTIADVSIALNGLPLAIIIAASWIKELGLAKLHEMILSELQELESIPTEQVNATDTQIAYLRYLHFLYLLEKTIIISPPMAGVEGRGEKQQPGAIEISPAMLLDQRLEKAGAYDRLRQLDPRRATLLQTYLTTEKSALDAGKEVGLRSRSRATEMLHSAMEVAFFALPEEERTAYGNSPTVALQTRSRQQTKTKSERLKEAHSNRPKNAETGKIEFSDTHRQHLTEGNLRRWQREREAQRSTTSPEQP